MTAKIVFSAAPKRSQSATNNNWATFARMENNLQIGYSPPSRDRPETRTTFDRLDNRTTFDRLDNRTTTFDRLGFQLPSTSSSHQAKQAPLSRIFSVPEAVERKKTDVLQRLFDV